MNLSLQDKTAIITGAGSGIGRAIAEAFAAQGARVQIVDIAADQAGATAADIQAAGGRADARVCDISDQSAVKGLVAEILADTGRIDILVNNAGIAHIGTAGNTEESDFDRIYRVNVKGVYNCLHAVLPEMERARSGVVLNMASVASITGIPDRFAYSTSKAAVFGMTLSVATDYIDKGIRCNCLCPARVHTPFVDGYLAKNYPGKEAEMFAKLSQAQPIGRMANPSEIADLALYLCSDASGFVTGASWPIDGGFMNVHR